MKKEQQVIPDKPQVSPAPSVNPDEAIRILENLCSLAGIAIGVSRNRSEECESIDDLEQRIQVLQCLVDRMGWVADVALRKLGHSGSMAGAEDWMMPGP